MVAKPSGGGRVGVRWEVIGIEERRMGLEQRSNLVCGLGAASRVLSD